MLEIGQIYLEVCGACQKNCVLCAHSGMQLAYPEYQLTIVELKKFIDCTKISGYFFETIAIHGIGEPLLWDHFEEGIDLLKKSRIGGKIAVITNGLLLDKIKDQTWEDIDLLIVSVYPNFSKHDLLQEKKEKYKDKIEVRPITTFKAKPLWGYRNATPCCCVCPGPMVVKDKIFLYCGPPVFDAAKLATIDIVKSNDLYVEIKPNYLETFDKTKIGNLKFCNYCWANADLPLPRYPYGYAPAEREIVFTSLYLRVYTWVLDFVKKFPIVYKALRKINHWRDAPGVSEK
jgi:hypothetical protein